LRAAWSPILIRTSIATDYVGAWIVTKSVIKALPVKWAAVIKVAAF